MDNAKLPDLGEGFDFLTLTVPVDLNNPATAEDVAPILVDAYTNAVAARMGGDK